MSTAGPDEGDGAEFDDAGLAHDRTDLAWNRSGLAVVVAVAIMLRHLWPLDGYKSVLALVLIAAGAVVWALGMRQALRTKADPDHSVLGMPTCRMLMLGTVILAAAAFVVGAVLPG
ncbi:MAG: DUF202 domain-containing protein [Acidimicrobiales bacterium]